MIRLELELLDPACRADRARLADLLHPDFLEHGTSGRLWTREACLDEIPASPGYEGTVRDMRGAELSADVVLITFRTDEPDRSSLRSSVWLRCPDGAWRMRFHQGTLTR